METRPYRAEQKGHINGEIGKEMRIESRGEEWDESVEKLSRYRSLRRGVCPPHSSPQTRETAVY